MIHLGVLSTAKINVEAFLKPVARRSDCQVVAIASRDFLRAARYADDHQIPKAYGAYQDLLDDPNIQAIYISTPNSLHAPWVKAALKAGKHVLCEKPFVTTYQDLQFVKRLALARNLLLMEAMHYRYHPALIDFYKIISQKILGRLSYIRASLRYYRPPLGDIRLNPSLKGGCLMHLGCYCLDAITTVLGQSLDFQDIKITKHNNSIDLACHAKLATADKATQVEMICDFNDDIFDSEVEIRGEKGELLLKSAFNPVTFVESPSHDIFQLQSNLQNLPMLSTGTGWNTYDYQLNHFISLLKKKSYQPHVNEQATFLLEKGELLVRSLLTENQPRERLAMVI